MRKTPETTKPKRSHPRQQAFTRSHHRASMRMRAGTLSGSMAGDPRDTRGYRHIA